MGAHDRLREMWGDGKVELGSIDLARGRFIEVRIHRLPAFDARLADKDRYDWDDLFELLPKRDREAPEALLGRVRRGFSFLAGLTGTETELAADAAQRRWAEAEALRKECRAIARGENPASTR